MTAGLVGKTSLIHRLRSRHWRSDRDRTCPGRSRCHPSRPHRRPEARIVTTDLTNDDQCTTAVDDLLSGGPVDVPINNAATVEPLGACATISPAQLRHAFENDVTRAGRGVRRAL